jgi:hypothetical protein
LRRLSPLLLLSRMELAVRLLQVRDGQPQITVPPDVRRDAAAQNAPGVPPHDQGDSLRVDGMMRLPVTADGTARGRDTQIKKQFVPHA